MNKMRMPRHLAIIMDGNGRWAAARGLPRSEGHKAGAKAVRAVVTRCRELGIEYLTLYAFSSENWSRPAAEIASLFSLLLEFLKIETPLMEKNGIRLNVLGDLEKMPAPQRKALDWAMRRTENCAGMTLNLALNYGARAELVHAFKSMLKAGLSPAEVDERTISSYLYTAGQPDPDFLVRTSGEQRLSNYLLYQCAYSEFYFTPVLWPDFDEAELDNALAAYGERRRRFGKTEEQIRSGD